MEKTQEGVGEKHLTVEEMAKTYADLEQQVKAQIKQKEADIAKQLTNRVVIIGEHTRLVPLLEEAEKTLKYFETQQELGFLKDAESIVKLERLRALVITMRTQKDVVVKEYEKIMDNPDVNEVVLKEANLENIKKAFEDKVKKIEQEIEKRVKEITDTIEQSSPHIESADNAIKEKRSDFMTAVHALKEIIDEASKKLDLYGNKTALFLHDLETHKTFNEYITGVKQHRHDLGFFKWEEKRAIDSILAHKDRFNEADQKCGKIQEARQYLETLYVKVDALVEQYKTLVSDVLMMTKEMDRGTSNLLLFSISGQCQKNLAIKSGLRDKKGQTLTSSPKQEEQYERLNSLFTRIEEKSRT